MFPRHVYDCGIRRNCLEHPFFSLNIMLLLNRIDRLETFEKNFHLKDNYQQLLLINASNQILIKFLEMCFCKGKFIKLFKYETSGKVLC